MGSNCGDNFAGLVWQMSTFEVRLSGRSGDGCGSEEFTGDARHVKFDVVVDRGEVET